MPKHVQNTAAPFVPDNPTIPKLRAAAADCKGCDLWKLGTQTVFGEGGSKPRVMLVGEQPGDQEDIQGHPFVGPAGKILDKALEAADIDRNDAVIELGDGRRVKLTNLGKVFWPGEGITKGDLLQYYADISPYLLPH